MNAIRRMAIAITWALGFFGDASAFASNPPSIVVAWGDNSYGQTNVPANLTNVVAIAGGSGPCFAINADSTITAWGIGDNGQTNVPAGLSNVVAVTGSNYRFLALRANGTLAAWGSSTIVPDGLTNVTAIAVGQLHCLALKAEGDIIAWGENSQGQTNVPAGLTNVAAIAAGITFSLAMNSNGTVTAWGKYWNNSSYVPMNVPGGLTGVVAIAAGGLHCLALKADSTVTAWGYNGDHQTDVPSGLTNVVAIAGGGEWSLALKRDGTLVTWGGNYYGERNLPAGSASVVAIAAAWNTGLYLAPLIVHPQQPPVIIVPAGANTNLSVVVRSSAPFSGLWSLNGVSIPGATGSDLILGNIDLTKVGVYSIAVSNQHVARAFNFVIRLTNSPVVLVGGIDVGGGPVAGVDVTQIAMNKTGSGTAIYFTLDGSAPDFTDIPYTGPFTLTNSATIRAIAYNAAYTDSAEAAPIVVHISPTYPLATSTPGGGSVGVSPAAYSGGNRYVSNTVVTLTATPANGWSFLRWTGDSTATTNVTTVLMDRPRTVQAVFGTSLNLFTNGSGSLVSQQFDTGCPHSQDGLCHYAFGSTVQLTAFPAPGAYFHGWAGAAGGFNNPLFITVTNASGLTALFGALNAGQVSLTVLPDGNGTVSVSPGRNVYTNGETVTLTAWPGANQRFTNWSGDASGSLNPLQLTLTASQIITANFVPGAATNPPVITQSPLSRTLSAGANTLLSFALTGDGPFAYQWRLNSSPLSGATNPTLLLTGVNATDAGRYDVVVSGAGGAVTSAPASVGLFGLEWGQGGGGPQPLLVLDGAPGASFRLEHSWNLSPTNWNLLAPVTLGGGRFYFLDGLDTNRFMRFYRAVPQ